MSDDVAVRAWQSMRELVLEGSGGQREACRRLNLSFVKIKALRHIAAGPLSLGKLAAALQTDAPYTSVIVSDLEQRGLAVRKPNPSDGRSKLVAATAAGLRATRTAEAILGAPPPALRDLEPNDLAALDRILGRIRTPAG